MTCFGETNENGQLVLRATGDFDPDTQHPFWALRCLWCLFGYRTPARRRGDIAPGANPSGAGDRRART